MENLMDMVYLFDLMGWSMRESLKVVKYVDMVRKYVLYLYLFMKKLISKY